MYVRLLTVKNYEVRGRMTTFRPGDWVDVPNQTARAWVADHTAEIVNAKAASQLTGTGCGIVICGDYELGSKMLAGKLPQVELINGDVRTAYKKTLIWKVGCPLRLELIPAGFHLLDTWEMCLPLASYKNLAASIGTAEERAETEALIHDLRVPYYDSRMIWARRCKDAGAVLDAFNADVAHGKNPDLSLLRAVYKIKPLVLSLPVTWIAGRNVY